MESNERFQSDLLQRVDVLIALLLERPEPESKPTMTHRIVRLKDLGVPPAEIARILGKTVNYVTGALSAYGRRGKVKRSE